MSKKVKHYDIFKAALWTDGRYWIQASQQLDCNWILMKEGEDGVPTMGKWLIEELHKGWQIFNCET